MKGTNLNDTLTGGNGADTIEGLDGDDRLEGGSGDDELIGGNGNDTLFGQAGDDRLDGGSGDDEMDGGAGNDRIIGWAGYNLIHGGDGGDTITLSYERNYGADSEGGKAYGDTGDDIIYGGSGGWSDDPISIELYGGAGNDTLGSWDSDVLAGGDGNDTVTAHNYAFIDGGDGYDTLQITYGNNSTANVINIEAITTSYNVRLANETAAAGSTLIIHAGGVDGAAETDAQLIIYGDGTLGDHRFTGGALNDEIRGSNANDVLIGNGGVDTLIGGNGDDTYYIDNAFDVVVEKVGGGVDKIYSSVSYTIGLKSYVQGLSLTGSADIHATGNNSENTLDGNAGNNALDGLGGADIMVGGNGNDTYYVDNAADIVVEKVGGGADTIFASVSYTIGLKSYVQTLTLIGTDDLSATGNNSKNTLNGNSGDNVLDGLGGADKMVGGDGNDTYYVDNAADIVVEKVGGGVDTIYASVSYRIGLKSYVQVLTFTGSDDLNGNGNNSNNRLIGNSGDNILEGLGGDDILIGNAGADVFLFGPNSGADQIRDFSASENDMIDLHAYNAESTAIISQTGADATIDLGGGNVITIQNTDCNDPNFLTHISW